MINAVLGMCVRYHKGMCGETSNEIGGSGEVLRGIRLVLRHKEQFGKWRTRRTSFQAEEMACVERHRSMRRYGVFEELCVVWCG